MLDGYHAGNGSGAIPINNGTLNTNLNAAMLGSSAAALVTPVIGEIRLYAGSSEAAVASKGWKFLNGQMLSKTTYSALHTLLGTTFGAGDTNNFDLPDLRVRFPLGVGSGKALAATGGVETNNLTHTHTAATVIVLTAANYTNTANTASGGGTHQTIGTHSHGVTSQTTTVDNSTGQSAVDNMPPYIALNYMIYTGVAS